jgi:hypothetical protein
LAASGKGSVILTNTSSLVKAYLENGAYWYRHPTRSFGFSEDSEVELHFADTFNLTSIYRMSWHLNGNANGGWRIGN